MTTKVPASAALLAQAVGDVAPFLGAGSSSGLATPTQELEAPTQLDMGAPTTTTWTETFCGPLGSRRRFVSFHLVALAVSTVIRSCLFSTELGFGKYLLENLAPVEREGVRWLWIVGMRALELAAGALVWKRVRGAVKHDGGERPGYSLVVSVWDSQADLHGVSAQPRSGPCSRSSRASRFTVSFPAPQRSPFK